MNEYTKKVNKKTTKAYKNKNKYSKLDKNKKYVETKSKKI